MREILGKAKTVRELLKGVKYSIDYYQREYKWESKQIRELIQDLAVKFLDDYEEGHLRKQVKEYGHYFLGSIIVSSKNGTNYVVDGQQRLTSLTLLLIYLRRLQEGCDAKDRVNVDELVFSEQYGEKTFNLDVAERNACMQALFEGNPFDEAEQTESVQNILARYRDIEEYFPEEFTGQALPYFIDWIQENVHLVEITAYSDDEAYTIFETMNDRGLSLSPTDMLKGFLLANITDTTKKNNANSLWKARIQEFNTLGKDYDADFFKAWLRSQYATKIRERKKGAKAEDFDRIGTEFHRWVRDSKDDLSLKESADFFDFVEKHFKFYSRQYKSLVKASTNLVPGYEHVLYNASHGFTLQYMILLAPLTVDDSEEVIKTKVRLASRFLDILIAWRLWNWRSIAYSTMQYAMFLVMRDIRRLDPEALARKLHEKLSEEKETFFTNDRLAMHQQNRKYLHRILARITDHVELESGGSSSSYLDYVSDTRKNRFEIEHIWANKPEEHTDEFAHAQDFWDYRNRIGGLLLLPKSFNASYGDMPYTDKVPHYYGQNLLAKSLAEQCYQHNPGFLGFVSRSGLPFKAHKKFKKVDLDERGELYRKIAEQIWNPDLLLREVGL